MPTANGAQRVGPGGMLDQTCVHQAGPVWDWSSGLRPWPHGPLADELVVGQQFPCQLLPPSLVGLGLLMLLLHSPLVGKVGIGFGHCHAAQEELKSPLVRLVGILNATRPQR